LSIASHCIIQKEKRLFFQVNKFTITKSLIIQALIMEWTRNFNTVTLDSDINSMLGDLDVNELNMQHKKVKKAGVISSIRIYYACDEKDLHKSIRSYINKIKKEVIKAGGEDFDKFSAPDKIVKDTKPCKVAEGSKINGVKINKDEVLIEYYLLTTERFSGGDKLTFQTTLKGETTKVFDDENMPVGLTSGRRVDAILSVHSPLARKVPDVYLNGYYAASADGLGNMLRKKYKL